MLPSDVVSPPPDCILHMSMLHGHIGAWQDSMTLQMKAQGAFRDGPARNNVLTSTPLPCVRLWVWDISFTLTLMTFFGSRWRIWSCPNNTGMQVTSLCLNGSNHANDGFNFKLVSMMISLCYGCSRAHILVAVMQQVQSEVLHESIIRSSVPASSNVHCYEWF